jgi:protein-S-isoprenylcysteine O-methyltransferase Ste14
MRAREGEHPWGDAVQLLLLGLFAAVWVADSFFWQRTTFLAQRVPLPVRVLLLVALLALGAWLVRAGHAVLDHDAGGRGVVTTGAFRYLRHPLYLGSTLFYLGLSVATASLAALVLTAGIFAFYDYIAAYEERWLEARYGEAYRAYRARTGKWWRRRRPAREEAGRR